MIIVCYSIEKDFMINELYPGADCTLPGDCHNDYRKSQTLIMTVPSVMIHVCLLIVRYK